MNTYLDCVPCFLRQSLEAARGITEDVHVHERIVRDVLRMTAELDLDQPGNFETLSGAGANIAFWFKVKCPVVARQVGLPVGTHALLPPTVRAPARTIALDEGPP